MNSNYQSAYVGIGKNYLRNSDYDQAIRYLSIADERIYRSKAYGYHREDLLYKNIGWVFASAGAAAAVCIFLAVRARKRAKAGAVTEKYPESVWGGLRYSFYIIFHPFKGFWDLKRCRRKKMAPSAVLIGMTVLSLVINNLYRGVFLSPVRHDFYNIFTDIITVLLPLILWCVSSCGFTSLMDSKGTFGDIFVSTCYALTPMILVYIPMTILSNFMTIEELPVYNTVILIAVVWTAFLIVSGLMITNDYSVSKTLATCILTVLGIAIILFLSLVAYSIIHQISDFVLTVYRETSFRT